MRQTPLFGIFLLFYFANTEKVFKRSSSETAQPQQTNSDKILFQLVVTSFTASPTWYLNVGDTVEFNCTPIFDKGNHSHEVTLHLLWTKMGAEDKTKTVLVSQKASTGINYILGPVTHEHSGIYTCDDDGSRQDAFANDWHHLIWVADPSPKVTLDVISHNRSQFLNREPFTLGCQLPDTNTKWKIMRFNYWYGTITECPNQESSNGLLSCTTRSQNPWADRLYWCESPTGERSNAINITTNVATDVILESPPLPVMEGEDMTLRCVYLNETTNIFHSNFSAVFFKNDRRIRVQTQGSLTLKAVTKADEGMYKCSHPEEGLSKNVWVAVKGRPDEDQKIIGT